MDNEIIRDVAIGLGIIAATTVVSGIFWSKTMKVIRENQASERTVENVGAVIAEADAALKDGASK